MPMTSPSLASLVVLGSLYVLSRVGGTSSKEARSSVKIFTGHIILRCFFLPGCFNGDWFIPFCIASLIEGQFPAESVLSGNSDPAMCNTSLHKR